MAHTAESSKLLTVSSSSPTLTAAAAGGTAPTFSPTAAADSAYRISATTTTPVVGASDTLTITIVDEYQNLSSYTGSKTITFGGLSAGADGSAATVAGTAFGTGTSISFTSGTATGSPALVAHKAESSKLLTATDGALTAASAGGTAPTLSPSAGADSAYRLTGTGQPVVGVGYTVTVTLVDQYQNVSSTAGTKSMTFNTTPTLSAGADSSVATINSVAQDVAANVTLTAGAGSVTLVAHKAESSKVITVTDGTLTSAGTGGTTLTVSPTAGADSAYRITAASGTPTAGASDALTIKLVDQYQNVSSYSGDKTLTFSGLGNAPAGNVPTVTSKAGTAVNLGTSEAITLASGTSSAGGSLVAYKKEGPVTLAATDGTLSTATTGGAGVSLTVSATSMNKFVLSLASPQVNGSAFTSGNTLTAEDQYGNTVSFDASANNVTIGANSPLTGAVSGLSGGNQLTSAGDFSSGVANLASLLTYTGNAGSGTFTASSATGSYTGSSGSVTISAGTATRLVITGNGSQTAGASQNLTITAEDASGNTDPTYTGSKSLTFSGANSSGNPVTAPTVKNSSGTAIAFGSTTAITFSSGVATVSSGNNGVMTLYQAESATVSVTDSSISSSGSDRLAVTVSATSMNKFVLSLTSP
ncbi:MAG: hypothetical protein ABSD62_15400, partial [Candidatus Limnocylindrales bacterium]